jgi:hypothetical protein
MLHNLRFFSSKCRLFHNATLFGSCIINILNTGCAKIWDLTRYAKGNECQPELYLKIVCTARARTHTHTHTHTHTNTQKPTHIETVNAV